MEGPNGRISHTGKTGLAVERFVVGPMAVNCYIVSDPASKEAFMIDPGADPDAMRDYLQGEGLALKFIINTHGHGDHIAANGAFGAPIFIHSLDADFLTDPERNLSLMFLFRVRSPAASRLLEDGDVIPFGTADLEILHTPGHTPGSVSIKAEEIVFTGDALFAGGIGRTDFPYGDERALLKSIRQKLLVLGDETVIYPGHGEPSTIGRERRSNPFLWSPTA